MKRERLPLASLGCYIALLTFFVSQIASAQGTPGKVLHELWMNKSGNSLSKIDWSSAPSHITHTDQVKGATKFAENYAQRLSCYVTIPADGEYTFWIAGDNESDLKIATDGNPANLAVVASVATWSDDESYEQFASQKSAPITLTAGQVIYLEARNAEHTGGDHVTVAWSTAAMARCTIAGEHCSAPAPRAATLLREKWNNISGGDVVNLTSSPKYPTSPDYRGYMSGGFDGPNNIGNNYGTRVRGYIVPTTTAVYNLLVSGDDQTYLYLSTDASPANKALVASVPSWSSDLQWNKYPSQKSAPINLVAGQKYYVELLQVEGGGSDGFAAAWQIAGGAIQVIPAANLQPIVDTAAPGVPTITVQNVSDQIVRLKLTATDDTSVYGYKVYRDGTLLGTITGDTYTDGSVTASTAYTYTAQAIDRGGKISAACAPVTVTTSAPAPVGTGTGLAGCYFNQTDLSERVLVRTDATVNFYWGSGSPAAGVDADTFSVAWVGEIEAQYTEDLTIHIESDDGNRVYFGLPQELRVDDWNCHGMKERTFTVPVVAGKRYPIRIEYFENTGGAGCKLSFSGPSFPKQIIPQSQLHPSLWVQGTDVAITTGESSITSPAFVEGRVGADATDITATVCWNNGANRSPNAKTQPKTFPAEVDRLSGTSWFTNVELRCNHAIDVSVTAGSNTAVQSITWTPTDIATAPANINVRVGDSLLLTCTGSGDTLEIDDGYDSDTGFQVVHTGEPGDKFKREFTTPGVYNVQARIDGVEIATIQVTVIGIDFQGSTACEVGFERDKAVKVLGGTATAVTFAAADYRLLTLKTDSATGATTNLKLKPTRFGEPRYIARLNTGAIVASQIVDEFELQPQASKIIGVVDEYEDGSYLVRTNMEMMPHVPGLEVRLHIFVSGVTFADSTLDMTLNTGDFTLDAETGYYIRPYELIAQPNIRTGTCHTVKTYQNGVQVGE